MEPTMRMNRLLSTVAVAGLALLAGCQKQDKQAAPAFPPSQVAVVTTKADRNYVPGNNDRLRALPASYPNVRLVDWATAAVDCPGDCFYDDGIHLKPDGRAFYAQQITAVTG